MNRIFFRVSAVTALLLILTTAAWAQGGTGELTGLITDPTGAVVPNAKLELKNSETGDVRTTTTTEAGVYRFPALPVVGTYSLKVEASGFRTVSFKDLVITVGRTVTYDVKMEVGAVTQVVEVVGGTQLIQTSESAVSTLVDRRIWQNMPLEVRSQNSFIELVAGAVPDAMAGSTRGAAVNGARGGTGNYLVEGTDNNEQGQGGRGQLGEGPGGASTSISPDAIQEYRVITNSFSAEYGKAGGFVTDTVLKSGTNQWHGSLFEYNRVQALAANHFFSNKVGEEDRLVRNQFGGSLGGPIFKDKTFFYYTQEHHRMRQSGPLQVTTTTQAYLDWVRSGGLQQWAESDPDGICMQYNGAACPGLFAQSASLGPIFSQLSQSSPFPLATTDLEYIGRGFWTDGLVYPVPVYGQVFMQVPYRLNEYRISAKLDHKLTDKDQLSGYFLMQTADSGDPINGGGTTIGPAYTNEGRAIAIGITWNHMFSGTLLNTFKAAYLRHRSDFPASPGTEGIPQIVTAFDPLEVGFGMYAGLPQFFTENQFQYQDHLSFQYGKHSFKFGGEYRRTRNGSSFYNDTYGTFYPFGIEDLVTDLAFGDNADMALFGAFTYGSVYYASAAVDPTTGGLPEVYRGFRANEYAFYFQDDWRITPRLTINWGLRYEYFGPPHNFRKNIDSNFYFGTPVTPIVTTSTNPYFPLNNPYYAAVATGNFQVRNNEIWNKDTNNWSPRIGLAYDVFGNQKLVLRAGAAIAFDRMFNNVFENIRFNPPYFSDNQIGYYANGVPVGALSAPGLYTVPFTSTGMFVSGFSAKPNPRHMDQNIVTPYYEQFHLGLQWEFLKGYMLESNYVGTMGHKLLGFRDINTFNGRTVSGLGSLRINNNIGQDNFRSNDYNSNYHGWQTTVRKRYSAGLAFEFNYTWSRALDSLSDVFNNRGSARPTDNMYPKNDYGPADFHMKHRFVGVVSYDLPFFKNNRWAGGWAVNSIITMQSGVPFSPYSSSSSYDLNKDGYATDRITYVGSGSPLDSLIGSGSPADGYFTTTDWARYTCPASVNNGQWCNPPLGRNSMVGPGFHNVNFGISKKFKVTERIALRFDANFFNLFNHPNFGLPGRNHNDPGTFGKSTSTFDPRITQLALRLDF
jgi:hypothetical protein